MQSSGQQYVRTYYVHMANITLSIDEELLSSGRRYAQARGTSLNSLVRELLRNTVCAPDGSVDAIIGRLRATDGDSKCVKFTREELHRY